MKMREKIHKYLQEKALNKAILKTIRDIGDYYIEEGELKFFIKNDKLQEFNALHFVFPSWKEIREKAVKYYSAFDMKNVKNVKYIFSFLEQEKDLNITAKDSDIYLGNNNFTNIKINDADNVSIFGDPLEDGGISINAKNIEILRLKGHINGNINLTSSCVEFHDISLLFAKNINLNSSMIEFNKSYIFSYNINLKSDLIVTEKSKLSAVKKINISNTNLDEIKEVDAPVIIYNGQDVSYSEGIVMPKLRHQLLSYLREIRNNVIRNVDVKVKESTQKQKESLESKPIAKILKK